MLVFNFLTWPLCLCSVSLRKLLSACLPLWFWDKSGHMLIFLIVYKFHKNPGKKIIQIKIYNFISWLRLIILLCRWDPLLSKKWLNTSCHTVSLGHMFRHLQWTWTLWFIFQTCHTQYTATVSTENQIFVRKLSRKILCFENYLAFFISTSVTCELLLKNLGHCKSVDLRL